MAVIRGLLSASLIAAVLVLVPGTAVATPADCFGLLPTIIGTPDDDKLIGTPRRDVIIGGLGNDVIKGLGGNDALCGQEGDDRIDGGKGIDGIETGMGADQGNGGPGMDAVLEFAEAGFTLVYVGPTDTSTDRLSGGPGPDWLMPEGGNDELIGGAGRDQAFFGYVFDPVAVDLGTETAFSLKGGLDSVVGIEDVSGSVYDDVLVGDDNMNVLFGVFGKDHLAGQDGSDLLFAAIDGDVLDGGVDQTVDAVVVVLQEAARIDLGSATITSLEHPTDPADTLVNIENAVGTDFDDIAIGDSHDNAIFGVGGNDDVSGGDGDDILYGDGPVTLPLLNGWWRSGGGSDSLDGGAGTDHLFGGPRRDTCTAGETVNSCEGGEQESREKTVRTPTDLMARLSFGPRSPWWLTALELPTRR